MPKNLSVYDMADRGVNVTKSPIHLEDGELTKAQNWQTDPTLADGAIRRRDAMTKLNSSALAGSVKGLVAMPFPDEFTTTRTFYAPIDDATTNTWRTSTDGASWLTITTATLQEPANTSHSNGTGGIFQDTMRGSTPWVGFNHRIYFPGDDYTSSEDGGTTTNPTLYSWDGTTAVKLFEVPQSPYSTLRCQAIVSIIPYGANELLLSCHDYDTADGAVHTRVLLYSTVDGSLEQLGPETDILGSVVAMAVFQGRVWIAPTNFVIGATLNIAWIRPGDPAWTTDTAFEAAAIGGVGMAEFLGDLYVGTHSSAATDAFIKKRTTATAAWSTVKSADGSGTGQRLGPLIVDAAGTTILAWYNSVDGTGVLQRILSSTDGTTWSTDLDVVADLGAGYNVPGVPYLDSDDSIYWAIRKSDNTGFIKKRTSAGTWSTVDTINNLRGPIVALKVV